MRYVDAAVRTRQPLGVKLLLTADNCDLNQATRQLHCHYNRAFQARFNSGLNQQAIYNHLDRVILALVEWEFVLKAD